MARNPEKNNIEMHTVGPRVWQENLKSLKMRNIVYRTWNMARNTEKHEI
jgi:hypothetical protein